jgi:hypothetical protein
MQKNVFDCGDNPYDPPDKRKNKPVELKEGDIIYSIRFGKTIKVVKNKLKRIHISKDYGNFFEFTNLLLRPKIKDFLDCVNPPNDASYHYYYCESRNEAVLFFSNEKDAIQLVIDQLIPNDIRHYQHEANFVMQQYMTIIEKVNESEKEMEFYKSKL